MPLLTSLQKLLCCSTEMQQEEDTDAPARRPLPEPAQAGPAQAGRPYRDYVENETDRYWRDMVKIGSLTKPDQQEVRAGAFLTLGKGLRKHQGKVPDPALSQYRAHQALNAMQLHLVESGRLKHPFTLSEHSPDYAEALVQLADDTGLLGREIPLPEHPAPRHPPIYFTINPVTKRPVPTKESKIRADYVYDPADGSRLVQDEYIYPWPGPEHELSLSDLASGGRNAYYTFTTERTGSWDRPWDDFPDRMYITYYWIDIVRGVPRLMRKSDRAVLSTPFGNRVIPGIHFSPRPPSRKDLRRHWQTRAQLTFAIS